MSSIAAVSIVGKKNEPLFLSTYDENEAKKDNGLRFHFYSHSALDIIEERLDVGSRGVEGRDLYLGLLFTVDTYKCYGYASNTKIKFILICKNNCGFVDYTIRQIFEKLHQLYVKAVCNPFSNLDSPLDGVTFANQVDNLVEEQDNNN